MDNRLIYIEKFLMEMQIPKKWRKRVEVYILRNGKILVGVHPEIGIHVPGGGVEENQNFIDAVKGECLEEAGVRVKNIEMIPGNYYEDWYKLQAEGYELTKKDKERMKIYRGIKHHYFRCDFDGYDRSILGQDNDKLNRIRWFTKEELIRAYKKQGKKFDPDQYKFRIEIVKKL